MPAQKLEEFLKKSPGIFIERRMMRQDSDRFLDRNYPVPSQAELLGKRHAHRRRPQEAPLRPIHDVNLGIRFRNCF